MKRKFLWLLIPIGFAIAILFPASLTPNLFTFKPFGFEEVGRLLSFLILIALFLERALEVFITTWRRPGEEAFDNDVQACERRITELKEEIEAKSSQPETTFEMQKSTTVDPSKLEERTKVTQGAGDVSVLRAEFSNLMGKAEKFKLDRTTYKAQTRKIALWTALFIGLLISMVGIRALETLVDLRVFPQGNPIFYNGQICVFRVLDTLLTGGLIAGGSDGIHKLTQVFTAFLDETRTQIKDKTN